MTGLEAYDALKKATKALGQGERFGVNYNDSIDLCKLCSSDLVQRGFDEDHAEAVVSHLNQQDLCHLGKAMGIELVRDKAAPSLKDLELRDLRSQEPR